MTNRENFFMAMSHRQPEQIPFFIRLCEELEVEFERRYHTADYRKYYGSCIIPVKMKPTEHLQDFSAYFDGQSYDYYNE